jgi:mannose-6-phosphate isomerase-like protein (cupin superfamily)
MLSTLANSFLDEQRISQNIHKKNLKSNTPRGIENAIVNKPWGYEYLLYQEFNLAIWLLYIAPGSSTSLHAHLKKKTTMLVLSGHVAVSGLSEKLELNELDVLKIEARTFHQSFSKFGAYLLEIEEPNIKLDLLRLSDNYGRNNSVYEGQEFYSKINKNYEYIDSEQIKKSSTYVRKFIEGKEIFIGRLTDLYKIFATKNIEENSIIYILSGTDELGNELRGEFLDSLKINCSIHCDFIVMAIYTQLELQTGSSHLSQLLEDNNVEVFTSVGEMNAHLLEALARTENLRLNIFLSDDTALKAISAYSKISSDHSIFIPSTSYSSLKSLTEYATNRLDSTYFSCLVVDLDFKSDKFKKNINQINNKGFPLHEILSSLSFDTIKLSHANNSDLIRLNRFLFRNNDLRKNLKVVLLSLDMLTRKFTLKNLSLNERLSSYFNDNYYAVKKLLLYFYQSLSKACFMIRLRKALRKSTKLTILLGEGARNIEKMSAFIDLLEEKGLPVFTTRSAIELVKNDSRSYYGRPGGYGVRVANHIMSKSDLILVLGSRMSTSFLTREPKQFLKKTKIFLVNQAPDHVNKKLANKTVILNFSLEKVILSLYNIFMDQSLTNNQKQWTKDIRKIFKKFNPHEDKSKMTPNNIYRFIGKITSSFNENDFVVVDGGELLHYVNQAAVVKKGQRWLNLSSLEQENYALSAALGVSIYIHQHKLSSRIKVICNLTTVLRSLESLQFIDSNQLPIDVFIVANPQNRYASVSHQHYYPHSHIGKDATINNILFQRLTDKLKNFTLIESHDIEETKDLDFSNNLLIYHEIPHNQQMDPRPAFFIDDKGSWIPGKLTKMFPLLELDELISAEFEKLGY